MATKTFNYAGIEKIEVSNLSSDISISNLEDLAELVQSKLNIRNRNDGLFYTVCAKNVDGKAVLYLFKGGNARLVNGEWYIRNDDDSYWYPIRSQISDEQPVLYLGDGILLA